MKESFAPPPAKLGLGLILLSLLFVISCEDQTLNDEQPLNISEVTNQRDVAFATENLSIYGASLLTFQKDSDFRKVLYAGIEDAFDGERNVLFKTLLQEDKNPIQARKLTSSLLGSKEGIMNAFANIEGKNYYPQLFIPFYDELKANGKLSIKDPVLVIYATDSPNSEYQGYSINNNGDLVKTQMVSEAYAIDNEVWVISINERVDNDGNLLDMYKDASTNSGRTMASPSAIVDRMTCKCNKESWAAGASEVNIITVTSDFGFFEYDINLYGKGDNEGGEIHKFSRSDVSNKRNIDLNFFIINDWDERAPNTPYGSYVIFEYDTWPTGTRTATWELGGATLSWLYRSADGFYDKQTVFKTNFSFHSVNNGCIEWTSQYQ